ncbi:hypothetical protein Patl1_06506 [Pistacia atlantica]|uniref:Uncharacterized protein n=1 Tax=Pistacia atlantica TaxID=434234 RepID=A0ACC1BPP1_9ROSI|nr:hypothetical protein Patl1_06506 [Pistacia atlantica]
MILLCSSSCYRFFFVLHFVTSSNGMKPSQSSNSLWEVDKSCMSWLDKKPPQSVIYRFLRVIRPGSMGGEEDDSTKELPERDKCETISSWVGLYKRKC